MFKLTYRNGEIVSPLISLIYLGVTDLLFFPQTFCSEICALGPMRLWVSERQSHGQRPGTNDGRSGKVNRE